MNGVEIDPERIYDDDSLFAALELRQATLARARRFGELRFTRKGQRTLYLGRWILEWLASDAGRCGNGVADTAPETLARVCGNDPSLARLIDLWPALSDAGRKLLVDTAKALTGQLPKGRRKR